MKPRHLAPIWYVDQLVRAHQGHLYALPYRHFTERYDVSIRQVEEAVKWNIKEQMIRRRPDIGKFHFEFIATGRVMRQKAPTSEARKDRRVTKK